MDPLIVVSRSNATTTTAKTITDVVYRCPSELSGIVSCSSSISRYLTIGYSIYVIRCWCGCCAIEACMGKSVEICLLKYPFFLPSPPPGQETTTTTTTTWCDGTWAAVSESVWYVLKCIAINLRYPSLSSFRSCHVVWSSLAKRHFIGHFREFLLFLLDIISSIDRPHRLR